MNKRIAPLTFGLTLLSLAGCGGSGGHSAPRAADPNPTPIAEDSVEARSGTTRRGIQALYFGALPRDTAAKITAALAKVGPGHQVELAYAPHFGSDRYTNALDYIRALSGKRPSLAIVYGHHEIKGDPATLGKEFYLSVFKSNSTAAQYRLSIANEDDYSDPDWKSRMTALLKGVVDAWKKDNPKGSFPTAQIVVRRCKTKTFSLASTFSPGNGYPSFAAESEYHFPASTTNAAQLAKSGYTLVSNDGWAVNDAGRSEPADLGYTADAKGKYHAIPSMTLSAFIKGWGGSNAILWHPAFHEWENRDGHYYAVDSGRKPISGKALDNLCGTIADFVR